MSTKTKFIAWIFQLIAAAILIPVGSFKFTNGQIDVFIFTQLGMEPIGRYIIGILEILAGLCLLSRNLSAGGGVLGIAVMCGAILAHTSVLGISVLEDNGKHILLLGTVFISSVIVIYLRRKELPVLGDFF